MVDAASLQRTHGFGHQSIEVRRAMPSFQQINREHVHQVLRGPHPSPHSCRPENVADSHNSHHWPAFLLTFGLQETYESTNNLHAKRFSSAKFDTKNMKAPEKLLYSVGQFGKDPGHFQFPRSIACTDDGDIVIADTENHRVQIFNSAGVLKIAIGEKNDKSGNNAMKFNNPVAVNAMQSGNIAVADRDNQCIKIIRPSGRLRFIFPTKGIPCALASDGLDTLYVLNTLFQVEVYKKGGKFLRTFQLTLAPSGCAPQTMTLDRTRNHILLCDTAARLVHIFDFHGQMIRSFEPAASQPGLTALPVGIALDYFGQLIISDAQNHTVNLYTNEGQFIEQLLGPTDSLGSVQGVAVSTEGHIVTLEFTINGNHGFKIFRYLNCSCHKRREVTSNTK